MYNFDQQALERYIQIVSDYCKEIISFLSFNYSAEVYDVQSLFSLITKQGLQLIDIGDKQFCFHGSGCTVYYAGKEICSWDFAGNGAWCSRVDLYKFALSLRNLEDYRDISVEECRQICDRLSSMGILEERGSNLFAIKFVELDNKSLVFPQDYDEIQVVYNGKTKIVSRNAVTDRFVRKSQRVYAKIENMDMNTELHFCLNGKEITTILYNPFCFDEGAVQVDKTNGLFSIGFD